MREYGDRPAGAAPGHVAVEREPIEIVAALRGQVRVRAADLGDAVRVLHRAHEVPGLVAVDP